MVRKLKNDLTGRKFSRWYVLEYTKNEKYLCRCDCGSIKEVLGGSLTHNRSKSCGCYKSPNEDEYRKRTQKRLKNRISIDSNGCWNWSLQLSPCGYGLTTYRKHPCQRASRVSYLIWNGNIPNGMFVYHKCDNPKCINPEHLFLGTHADNMRDMKEKGRACKGENSHLHKSNRSKFNEQRIGKN